MTAFLSENKVKDTSKAPKYTPIHKIVASLKKTGSVQDTAKILGLARNSIYDRFKRQNIDINEFLDYSHDKALNHELLQYRISKALTTDSIKKMPGGSKVLAICQLEDKIRLLRGESTSNISTKSTIEHIDSRLQELDRKREELMQVVDNHE